MNIVLFDSVLSRPLCCVKCRPTWNADS